MKNRWFVAAAAFVLVVSGFLGLPALAQQTGSIEGTVIDSGGSPLPGVSIEVKSSSLQGTRTGVTDSQGRFRFPILNPGTYTVSAALAGFGKVEKTGVRVPLGATAVVNATLAVSVKEEIIVTGEAPVVDTTTTTAGTNYRAEVIDRLPIGRNYADVVRLQPGVQTDNGETQSRGAGLTIYGSTSAENLYLIDGVNTTNVIKGIQGKAINNEFVEEVEVKTGGYQAEFGRNTGGVVNVITKQGGNEFHGGVFGYWNNASTSAAPISNQSAPYAQTGDIAATTLVPTNTRSEIGLSLGGYFIKDRIWFFGAYDHVKSDIQNQPLTGITAGQNFPYTQTSDLYSGKLTFRITDGTTLAGSVFSDPQKNDGALGGLNSLSPDSYTATQDIGGLDASIRLSQLFSTWGLLNLQYGRHKDKYLLSPVDTAQLRDYAAYTLTGDPIVRSGGWGSVPGTTSNNESVRDAFGGTFSLFFAGHEVKFGGDYQKATTSGVSYYTGMQLVYMYPCIQGRANYNCDLTKAPIVNTSAGRMPVYYRHYTYTNSAQDLTPIKSSFNVPDKSYSFFIQDEWKVMPNLTVNLGVRYDDQQILKGDASVAMDLKDQWSPRVGFSWDFLNNGTSKLYASYGRFGYQVPTDLAVRVFTSNTGVQAYNYSGTNVYQDPTAPRKQFTQVGTLDGEPVDPGIKASFSDEYTIGIEKAFTPSFSLGAKYTYRTLGRTIEDRCDLDPSDPGTQFSSCAIFNPGGSGPAASGQYLSCNGSENPTDPTAGSCGNAGVPVGDAKRIFRGFELVAKKRLGDSLWMQASYLYSTLVGNYSGAIRTASGTGGAGQTDPGINADFDYYQFAINGYGNLELDRPHQFRLDTAYTAPFGMTAGVAVRIRSGVPISKLGYFNSAYPDLLYVTTRGSEGRTPTEWDADLSLGYTIKLGPVQIVPQIYLFNAFNNQQATAYNQQFNTNASFVTNPKSPFYGQPGVEPGTAANCPATATGPCSDNPDYGKVASRTNPRQFRVAVKVTF